MMRFGGKLNAPFVEQETRRGESLVTPFTFDVTLGASPTTIYAGTAEFSFLLRKVIVVNSTAGAINLVMRINGSIVVPTVSIAANTAVEEEALDGLLLNAEVDFTGTGGGLRVLGWGVRVAGGDGWAL